MDAELRRRIAIGRQDVRALDAGLGAQCGDETPDTGIGRVGNLRQQDGNIEFELFGHHAVSALVLVSARASRRISMPPLIAIRAVARPTSRSGQFVPSQSTRAPAIRMPPLEMKSLKLNVVAARRRSEEHTSELQSLMRISYAVFS